MIRCASRIQYRCASSIPGLMLSWQLWKHAAAKLLHASSSYSQTKNAKPAAQMVHPQKRLDMKRALEACMGRLLEVRAWMVSCAPLVLRLYDAPALGVLRSASCYR